MNVVILIVILTGILFAMAYFTKRRFGMLGLALAAGSTLSHFWASDLAPIVQRAGVELIAPPLESVMAVLLIVTPAILLLFVGPKYSGLHMRVIGALVFALLGLAFLLEPLGGAVVLQGQGRDIYDLLVQYRPWIITGGIAYALFDIVTYKPPKLKE